MNKMRRTICQSLGGLLSLAGLSACSQPVTQKPQRVYTEEEQRYVQRFGGVGGCAWYLSSVHELRWIEIRDQNGREVDTPARVSPGSSSMFSLGVVPIRLKVTWREQDPNNPIHSGNRNEAWSGGKITGNFEIPVADRIPDDLLDDLRRDPKGGLRIKIRLHREGVLLGWDIERRPGYDTKKRDSYGEAAYVAPAYSFTGGDFKEARPANSVWENGVSKPLPYSLKTPLSDSDEAMLKKYGLKLGGKVINPPTPTNHRYILERGWYIDPRTKERIETDY